MGRRTVFDIQSDIVVIKCRAGEIDSQLQALRTDRRSLQTQLDALYQERARHNQKSQQRQGSRKPKGKS